MASLAVKLLTKKFVDDSSKPYRKKKTVKKDDPFFELVPVPGKPGKVKKVKKQIPNYIPDHDALILARARKIAYIMDMSFSLFGMSIGIGSLVGFIPFLGDIIDLLMAAYLVKLCKEVECGLDPGTMSSMKRNVFFDFIIGLIPVIGDISDTYFRCNTKNVELLSIRLDEMYMPDELKKAKKMNKKRGLGSWSNKSWTRGQKGATSNKKDIGKQSEIPYSPATVYEEFSDDESPGLPFTEPSHQQRKQSHQNPRRK